MKRIFDRQKELMDKYHIIEKENCRIFEYQDENVPVDLDTIAGQARVKHLAWYCIEEIAEALDCTSIEQAQEEIVDAIHFFVELCITSGLDESDFEPLEVIYNRVRKFGFSINSSVSLFLQHLGMAMNRLKNKPWKRTHTPVNINVYRAGLILALTHLIHLAYRFGITTPKQLINLYMGKAEINRQRQEAGY